MVEEEEEERWVQIVRQKLLLPGVLVLLLLLLLPIPVVLVIIIIIENVMCLFFCVVFLPVVRRICAEKSPKSLESLAQKIIN